ncbi:hypothetical protein DL765_002086 [Monosporascus sp. GIB2]|nr:hypothetical protein DL765_002086 [Monosporascus sp. GIB2]
MSSNFQPLGYSKARCKDCRTVSTKGDIWICVQCRGEFCDNCWGERSAHNSEGDPYGIDFEPSVFGDHEKVSREVYHRLTRIFAPLSEDRRGGAHEMESQAKWFGICRGVGNQWYFGDTDRLTSIIDDSWTAEFPDQFPSVVSFVGQTVFVLKEARTLETVVSRHLIPWAAKSIYKSINQAAQPHLIVVLNAADISISKDQWDHTKSTKAHLDALKTSFENDEKLTSTAKGLPSSVFANIHTVEDLLKHFYASVTIINIPQKGYHMRMDSQVRELYGVIEESCWKSHERKKEARVLLKAEKLERVLASVFDHFSHDTESPFNFLSESLWQSPIPGTLGGNILQFALAFQRSTKVDIKQDARKLFDRLVPIISSCIMLDIERSDLHGSYEKLLDENYSPHLRNAFETFCESWLHCAFQHKSERCCNVKQGHGQKGHQGANGNSLGKGPFELGFDSGEFLRAWNQKFKNQLQSLRSLFLKKEKCSAEAIAAEIHRKQMSTFLSNVRTADFASHRICLCCLRHSMPEYPMPCGQVLCTACMRTFRGKGSDEDLSKNLTRCPFHSDKGCCLEIDEKPLHAGVRMLCLDGGGIRGVIQLAILRAIEKEFEGSLRIQWFFDLVVGTSAGGIIALNLFVKDAPLDKCMKDFKTLCSKAFTPRELRGVPLFGKLAMVNHGSIYKTRPLESILQSQDILGNNDLLFGGKNPRRRGDARVAVTSTEETSKQRAVILANYNRPQEVTGEEVSASYGFVREERPCDEMKIWEAARATSAAFPYFKPFFKNDTKREFSDGGLYHNCPVKVALNEKRLLWDDVRAEHPDIMLSLGTGRGDPAYNQSNFQFRSRKVGKRGFLTRTWDVAAGLLENILACQSIWSESVRESTESCRGIREYTSRYFRLNIDIPTGVPKLDTLEKMDELETLAVKSAIHEAREVAHRLIASCFYLRLDTACRFSHGTEDLIRAEGTIQCRFDDKSEQLKGLGRFLEGCLKRGGEPTFFLQERYDPQRKVEVQPQPRELFPVDKEVIRKMCDEGTFSLPGFEICGPPSTTIRLSIRLQEARYSHDDCYLSISGSPRRLDADAMNEECRANRKESGIKPRPNDSAPPPAYAEAIRSSN